MKTGQPGCDLARDSNAGAVLHCTYLCTQQRFREGTSMNVHPVTQSAHCDPSLLSSCSSWTGVLMSCNP